MKKAVRAAKGTTQIIWLGVASLVGVGLLAWVGSMLLPTADAEVAEPEAVETADVVVYEAAEIDEDTVMVDRGTWIVFENRDPMDDSLSVFAFLQEDGAALNVFCREGEIQILIMWDDYLGTDRTVTVTHRIPPLPAERASWLRAADATGAPDPMTLARGMVAGMELIVRTTPYMSGPVTVTFDLTGAEMAIGKVAESCGAEL